MCNENTLSMVYKPDCTLFGWTVGDPADRSSPPPLRRNGEWLQIDCSIMPTTQKMHVNEITKDHESLADHGVWGSWIIATRRCCSASGEEPKWCAGQGLCFKCQSYWRPLSGWVKLHSHCTQHCMAPHLPHSSGLGFRLYVSGPQGQDMLFCRSCAKKSSDTWFFSSGIPPNLKSSWWKT